MPRPSRNALTTKYDVQRAVLEVIAVKLQEETQAALEGVERIDRISFRAKETASFVKKAFESKSGRTYDNPFTDIEDQIAGRILVHSLQDIQIVLDSLIPHTFNTVESSRKEPKSDEEFGYESHHLIMLIPPHLPPTQWENNPDMPCTFELQIRTLFMHAWAEPQHKLDYKGSKLPRDIRRELAWMAASAWGADKALQRIWDWKTNPGDPTEIDD